MIAGAGGYQYQQIQTRNKLCDAIFTAGFNPDLTLTRSGDQSDSETYSDAINKLKNGEINQAITALEELYGKADDEMKIEYGTSLAYAYVKAHDLEKAWDTINKVKSISRQLYGETPLELESLIQAMNGQNLK
jgi:predicted Zn-dependent protease